MFPMFHCSTRLYLCSDVPYCKHHLDSNVHHTSQPRPRGPHTGKGVGKSIISHPIPKGNSLGHPQGRIPTASAKPPVQGSFPPGKFPWEFDGEDSN